VLVDPDLRIVHPNRSAERMLTAGDPIVLRNGRLALRQEIVPGQLEAAVAEANVDGADGRRGLGIPTRTRDGKSVALHVLPLERRQTPTGIGSRAVAAIFVSDVAAPLRLPADAVALLYQLTPAETRVAELLAKGETLPAIAAQLGSSPHTVRTHLNRVFDKTGCHRQADLVRLLSATQLTI
jgi:DNA-binding CsgD family transcriptional regulator